jgi:zona occludens toxin
MSILAYVGLPGSGKSYGVVANQIITGLKEGRTVVTNIPLYEDRIREIVQSGELREFPIDKVAQEPELIDDYAPAGCVLIIDELWKLFPAGQKVNHVPQPYKKLLAEHRHMVDEQGRSTQIVFVTQDLAQIGAFARQLVEQTFLHTKLGHLGASGSYRCRIFHGQVTGQNPPKSSEIRMVLGRYDERIYRLYKSHTMSKAEGDGANEKPADTRANIWKRPVWLIAGGACVVVTLWSVSTLGGIFGSRSAPAGASVATAGPARPSSTTRAPLVQSIPWRVTGFIDLGKESLAILESERGQTAIMDARECQRSRWMAQCKFKGEWWPYEAAAMRTTDADAKPALERATESMIPKLSH